MQMRTVISCVLLIIACNACSGPNRLQTPGAASGGHTRTKEVEFIDQSSYKLTDVAIDSTYAYDQSNPVKVGGVSEMSGPVNERRFLNGLEGPNGETIQYHRIGSCCSFKTSNGFGNTGLLDTYKLYWDGCKDTATIFINMYDKGDLKIPVGLNARK